MIKKVLLTPFQKFIKIEGFSGILLLLSTIVALIWANSGFAESYTNLWSYKVGIVGESFQLQKPLLLLLLLLWLFLLKVWHL